MAQIESLFVTRLYRARLSEFGPKVDPDELVASCNTIAEDDEAGQQWCEDNDFPGYTSYASLSDLPWRFPIFKTMVKALNKHVAAFADDLQFDLDGRKLMLDDSGSTSCPKAARIPRICIRIPSSAAPPTWRCPKAHRP